MGRGRVLGIYATNMRTYFLLINVNQISLFKIYLLLTLILNIKVNVFAQEGQNFYDIKSNWIERLENMSKEEGQTIEEYENFLQREWMKFHRWNHLWRYRLGPNGDMTTASIEYSKFLFERQEDVSGMRSSCDPFYATSVSLENLGPFNSIGALGNNSGYCGANVPNKQNQGRLDAISVNPTNPNIILAGAWNGGIWRTTDGGSNWVNTTDDEGYSLLGISQLTRHPADPNIVYATTGVGGGLWESSRASYGMGVIVSTDDGVTWQTTGLSYNPLNSSWKPILGAIAIDPASTLTNTVIYTVSSTDVYKWEGGFLANGVWPSIYHELTWYNGPLWWNNVRNNDLIVTNDGTLYFSNLLGLFKDDGTGHVQVNNYIIPTAVTQGIYCGSPA
jgi:hypothetical protein